MRLTAKQIQTLRLIASQQITGTIDADRRWTFSDGSKVCTAAVMALSAKALISILSVNATLAVSLTERGRKILSTENDCHA